MSKDLEILNILVNSTVPATDVEFAQLGDLALALVGGGSGALVLV